jgi:small subunit ribosomal protein S4
MVNGRRVDVPSFQVKPGMTVSVKDASRKNPLVVSAVDQARSRGVPRWLALEAENFSGTVVSLPGREDITLPIQEQLIVELYSK